MKRTFLKATFAAFALALLAGCATGVKHSEMAAGMPSLKAGEGRIYFYRTNSMFGAAIQPEIRLDGVVVGQSRPGGFFYVDRPAGNYVPSASTEVEKTGYITLQAGDTRYIRTSVGMGVLVGRLVFEHEEPGRARAELDALSYTGSVATK
ncbi:MAG: hypothetical protein K0S48_1335 [Ramlibacter sp.]|nr:hypothetical protein [Ramlibacter sp.]